MDIKGFWKEKGWKKWKKDQWLVVFLIGVLLLVIAIPTNNNKETAKNTEEKTGSSSKAASSVIKDEAANSDYEESLETRLAEILRKIEGVGAVQVMITLKDGGEAIVEKDKETSYQVLEQGNEGSAETTQHESSEVTIYENQTDDASPFISKENTPQVEGVLVVAQGGNNAQTAQNISEAIQALFDIEVHKIKIVKMNMQEGTN